MTVGVDGRTGCVSNPSRCFTIAAIGPYDFIKFTFYNQKAWFRRPLQRQVRWRVKGIRLLGQLIANSYHLSH